MIRILKKLIKVMKTTQRVVYEFEIYLSTKGNKKKNENKSLKFGDSLK